MVVSSLASALSFLVAVVQPTIAQSSNPAPLTVHNITRSQVIGFENLAVRSNGQILATSTQPNASIYQIDPLGILPDTLIYEIPNITSTNGIAEGQPDVFYVASGDINLKTPASTVPSSYSITQLDVRGVYVLPDGTLNQKPIAKKVASLPDAALLNGIAFASPDSDNLLVADSFRGLIWNVNVSSGAVGITLNDTTTRGPTTTGSGATGINGLKVFNGSAYYTNTGTSSLYKAPVDEEGNVPAGVKPTLVTANLTCDDLVIDCAGNAYVASPFDFITQVSPTGQKEIIVGAFNSTASPLIGPTAIKFGRMVSDQWSLYITTDGGLKGVAVVVPGSAGVSRIDLSSQSYACAQEPQMKQWHKHG